MSETLFFNLFHGKATCLLDSYAQLIEQQLIAVVCRNIDSIKARVRLWQVLNRNVARQVNGEETRRGGSGVAL